MHQLWQAPRNGMSKTEKNLRSQHGLIGIDIVAFSLTQRSEGDP